MNLYDTKITIYRSSLRDQFFAFLLLVLVALYSWRMMLDQDINYWVNGLKLIIPIWMLIFTLQQKINIPKQRQIQLYILFFFLFIFSSLISSVLSFNPEICFVQWLKLFSRWLMVVAFLFFMIRWPQCKVVCIKIFVYLGFIVFVQYMVLFSIYYFGLDKTLQFLIASEKNPFGMLGGVDVQYTFGLRSFRLTSFWLEPSKASGFLFSTFFLSLWLYSVERLKKWKIIAITCLTGGIACMSNAGYLALGSGAVVYATYMFKKVNNKKRMLYLMILSFAFLMVAGGVLGRWLMITFENKNEYLAAAFGTRISSIHGKEMSFNKISSGRIQLMEEAIQVITHNPLGIGVQIPGYHIKQFQLSSVSATAPVLWLTFTGLPGLLLLICAIYQIAKNYFSLLMTRQRIFIYVAWVCAMAQEMVYGDWIDPFSLWLGALVLVSLSNDRNELA